MTRRSLVFPLLLGLLLANLTPPPSAARSIPAEAPVEPVSVVLPIELHSLPVRISRGGERFAIGLSRVNQVGRGLGILGVVVFDPIRGEEVWRDDLLAPGREVPHFDREGTRLAWCEPHLVTGEESPRTPTVIRMVDLKSGERTEAAVATNPAAEKVDLVALDPDGSHAILREQVRGQDDALVVVETKTGEVGMRVDHYVPVGFGRSESDVTLTERWLIAHLRTPSPHRRAETQLVVVDRRSGEEVVRTGAYVCRLTPRYALAADDRTLWNGTGEFVIETFSLPDGARSELANVRKPLYSHFLELTLSPDEKDLVAWSDERKNWVHFVVGEDEPRPIALERRADVWGIDRWGRLWCSGPSVRSFDLRAAEPAWVESSISGGKGWLAAKGSALVIARPERPLGEDGKPDWRALPKRWTVEFRVLEAPTRGARRF